MTAPELDALLAQYPGWIAIERLVARIRALEDEVLRVKAQMARLVHGDNGA
jgi:hypothetical protein